MAGTEKLKADTLEKEIENYLIRSVKKIDPDGLCWKFVSPGTAGVPDRIVILNGRLCFVELKRPKGGRTSELQRWRRQQLRKQLQLSFIVNTPEDVDRLIICMCRDDWDESYDL